MYADKDINLVDDTLSALDSQVSQAIFKDVIMEEFKQRGKSVILVTHNLSILDQMDRVLLIDNGSLVLSGKFEDIRYKEAYVKYSSNVDFDDTEDTSKAVSKNKSTSDTLKIDHRAEYRKFDDYLTRKDGALIQKEQKSSGRVKGRVYWAYIKRFNPVLFFVGFKLFFVYVGLRNISDYWIGLWSKHAFDLSTADYMNIYTLLVCSMVLIVLVRSSMIAFGMSLIGIRFNREMMATVFRRPIAFFESTPLGVIINRCTREMLDIDLAFNYLF